MIKNGLLNDPGAAIKTGSSALAKAANAFQYVLDGIYYTKAAADFPALTGISIGDDQKRVLTVLIDTAGTFTLVNNGTDIPLATNIDLEKEVKKMISTSVVGDGKLPVSTIVITNETGSAFTGGTTALDVSNLTVAYIDWFGPLAQDLGL